MLGLDALSSAAYGPEAALSVMIPAGALGLVYIWPLMSVLLALLLVLFLSYRQTIAAYPHGGGSYTVAKENLGTFAGLLAAASLILDYILNVAVGISAGVENLVSAVPRLSFKLLGYPFSVDLHLHMVALCLAILVFICFVNLRGVKESGVAFMLPTYLFCATLLFTIGVGLWKSYVAGGHPVAIEPVPVIPAATITTITGWLLIKAFASGCTAMTGVEAVSNGVPAFRQPGVQNAQRTLGAIIVLLAIMLAGIAHLCKTYGIMAMDQSVDGAQSVLSMMVGAVMGRGWFYYLTQLSILTVVALSANTSFADFPRLCRLIALDDFLPRFFTLRGRRLVFHVGILILGLLSAILLVAFGGITDRLIPLFAIGALGAFTLSQAGMVVHWVHNPGPGSGLKMAINGVGAICTAFAVVVVLVAKFADGAFITVALIPMVMLLFYRTRLHYSAVSKVTLREEPLDVRDIQRPLVVVPVRGWTNLAARGLRTAMSLSDDVFAVTISTGEDTQEVEELNAHWSKVVDEPSRQAGRVVPQLVVLESPYRDLVAPLLRYLDQLKAEFPTRTITVIVPQLVESKWYYWLLHNQRATLLKASLLFHGDSRVTVLNVPWYFQQRKRTDP